jgi:acyl transferase domain-containing protein
VQFGVFLQGIESFDAVAFGVSGPEAALMDPQQRLLLSCTAEVLMTGNGATGTYSGVGMASSTGTFVGVSSMDYNKMSMKYTAQVTPYTSTGASLSVAAGRISYTFNLKGPALSVDTACSSSLVASHAAFNALNLQQCQAALAAGVNLMLSPDTPAAFQKAGMLAPDGRCKTLDAAADGYVRAEAVGVMLLMPLDVVKTGGQLCAVLLGSAVNQDGRSSALTAPNGPSQQEVIGAALTAAGIEPGQVSADRRWHTFQ